MKKLILLPLLFISFAHASDKEKTNSEELNNIIEAYNRSDELLNYYYDLLAKELNSSKQKELLEKSKLSWTKFREDECIFQKNLPYNNEITRYKCLQEMTDERASHIFSIGSSIALTVDFIDSLPNINP